MKEDKRREKNQELNINFLKEVHIMFRRIICLVSIIFVLGFASAVQGTDYYVSPSGDDGAAGTSPSTAWQTIGKVNTVTFNAGDSILFEGGETFSGQLSFDDEGGTSTSPITVSSYGSGRATLSNSTMGVEGSASTGLGIYNNAGFEINNLILVGPGNTGDRWDENVGVRLDADLGSAGARVDYIRIDNIEVSNYSGYGILVMGYGYSGFRDVEITNCVLYGIGKEGICSKTNEWPMNQSSHNDFYIADCVMHDITGVGSRSPHSGSGINLSALDGALVEFNLAYSGGEWCMADGGGPLGMWCWETENIVFQFNEVHDWQTMGGDGGGFDLDGGTSYGTIQYCYSHDNFGGDLLMQFARSRPAHDYIYRYNINANQGQLKEMGAITFYTDKGSQPYNVEVYNNTIYVGPDAQAGSSAIDIWYWKGGSYSNINIRNNIFIAEAGKKLISYQKIAGFTFQNNLYWQSGEPLVIDGMGTIYTSLADWRAATGQEMLNGQPVGIEIGPQLVNVHDHPILGPHNLANLSGFKLKSTSQGRDAGLDLQTEFGIDPGTRDFWGNSIPQGSLFDIGGQEYPGGGSAPAPDSTPPAAPTGLTATVAGSSIDLDWADNGESDLSHYSVKRSTSPGGPYTQIISNLNASAYTDKAIVPSITYYYVVTATDTSSNQSGNSNEDSANVTYPGVLIFSDGFESGDFGTGGWIVTEGPTNGTATVTTEAAYTGTYGATIGKLASIQKGLSTAGYTDIRIRYMRNTINTARRGCSIVWWDGTDLHPIEVPIEEPWGLKDIICGPDADNNPDFFLFFRENGPGPSERTFVDDVEIWGIGATPSPTPTATPTPTPTATPTPTPTPTPTATPGPDMYVNDIAMTWYEAKSGYYTASATVWIKDEYTDDVDGATVTGAWSGATTKGDTTSQTGQDGKVTLVSKATKGGGTFTFTVTDVSATGFTYNPALNVMDSNSVTAP